MLRIATLSRVPASIVAIALTLCLFVSSVLLVNATLTTWRIDLTENKRFTLSAGTLQILATLEEPVHLDFYFSQQRLLDYPQLALYGARVRDTLLEYTRRAEGKLVLNILNATPFSRWEEEAIAAGLQSLGHAAEERAWFGLAGYNTSDDEQVIPFFHTHRETSLEYDITQLVQRLSQPSTQTLGIISALPAFTTGPNGEATWAISHRLREFFILQDLGRNPEYISPALDTLLLVHPKQLPEQTLYAIDQYLLGGGKAMIFIDPMAEHDPDQHRAKASGVIPKLDSTLGALLTGFGLRMDPEQLVADAQAAIPVQAHGPTGPMEVDYLPWLRLSTANFNQQVPITSSLKQIHMGTVGHLEEIGEQALEVTPLLYSSTKAMLLPRDLVRFQPDPRVILQNFKASGQRFTLAARVQGRARTAYPEGPPGGANKGQVMIPEGELHLIVVADSDILADRFWTRPQTVMGQSIPQAIANNSDFVINSLESLSGDSVLSTLRSRAHYSRPFLRVEALRRKAERRFLDHEQALQKTLQETEERLQQLQQVATGITTTDSIPAQEIREIEQLRLETHKALRVVRHELRNDIESLGTRIRFINITLMPLLIILFGLVVRLRRMSRYRTFALVPLSLSDRKSQKTTATIGAVPWWRTSTWILPAVTLLVLLLTVAVLSIPRKVQSSLETPLFLPQLDEQHANVNTITIQDASATVHLSKTDSGWVVEELDGYPTRPGAIRTLLERLAGLRVQERPRTVLERLYPALGVQGPIPADSPSVALTLQDAQEMPLASIIIGLPRKGRAAIDRPGHYIRRLGDRQTWLTKGALPVSAHRLDWIQRLLFDIPGETVQEIRVRHADGDHYRLYRDSRDTADFHLEPMPTGMQPAPAFLRNKIGTLLQDFQVIDVHHMDSLPPPQEATQLVMQTFDGLIAALQVFLTDEVPQAHIHFTARVGAVAEVRTRAADLNRTIESWIFTLPDFKYALTSHRSDHLMKPIRGVRNGH